MNKFIFVDAFPDKSTVDLISVLIKSAYFLPVVLITEKNEQKWDEFIENNPKKQNFAIHIVKHRENVQINEENKGTPNIKISERTLRTTSSDIFYFTNPSSNLYFLSILKSFLGHFIIKLPFSDKKSFYWILKYCLKIKNRIHFVDISQYTEIRLLFNYFFNRLRPDLRQFLNDSCIESVSYQNMRRKKKTTYGMVIEDGICGFMKSLTDILQFKAEKMLMNSFCDEKLQKRCDSLLENEFLLQKQKQKMTNSEIQNQARPEPLSFDHFFNHNSLKSINCLRKGNLTQYTLRNQPFVTRNDTFSFFQLKTENETWRNTKFTCSAGTGFTKDVNRTVLRFRAQRKLDAKTAIIDDENDIYSQIYEIFYTKAIFIEEKSTIYNISLIFEQFPNPKIYLKIKFRDSSRKITLLNTHTYQEIAQSHFNYFFDDLKIKNFTNFYTLFDMFEIYRIFWYFFNENDDYCLYEFNSKIPRFLYEFVNDDFKD